jgi:hypothetical protein
MIQEMRVSTYLNTLCPTQAYVVINDAYSSFKGYQRTHRVAIVYLENWTSITRVTIDTARHHVSKINSKFAWGDVIFQN